MSVTFPNESSDYRTARNALLDAEIALRQQLETVAEQRRALPPGGEIPEDYTFTALDGTPAPLSSLFGDQGTLALYSFMYAPGDNRPCPACTSLVDGWNGLIPQIKQSIAFAAVAKAPPEKLAKLKDQRGWQNLAFYSSGGTSYHRDYFGETGDGTQRTFMNVFTRTGGTIRHFWGSEMERADLDGHPRHLDTTWPIWGILDLTDKGRGDGFPDVFAT